MTLTQTQAFGVEYITRTSGSKGANGPRLVCITQWRAYGCFDLAFVLAAACSHSISSRRLDACLMLSYPVSGNSDEDEGFYPMESLRPVPLLIAKWGPLVPQRVNALLAAGSDCI